MPSVISGIYDGSELCRYVHTACATLGIVANYRFWLIGEWVQRNSYVPQFTPRTKWIEPKDGGTSSRNLAERRAFPGQMVPNQTPVSVNEDVEVTFRSGAPAMWPLCLNISALVSWEQIKYLDTMQNFWNEKLRYRPKQMLSKSKQSNYSKLNTQSQHALQFWRL